MRMHEISLYHGSQKEFPVGFILTPQNDSWFAHTDDSDVDIAEKVMEQYRPEGHLSRRDSVYMVDDPDDIDNAGGYIAYIYKVVPIGSVEKNDLHWYTEISNYAAYNELDDDLIQAAKNYWAGVASENPLFEYRSKSAKIIEIVEINENEF